MTLRIALCAALLTASSSAAQDGGVVAPRLVRPSPAAWPLDAGTAGGDVELLLTVDEAGAVVDVRVERSPAAEFTDAARAAAAALRFEPATSDGVPVSVVLGFRYHFEAPPPRTWLRGTVFARGTREAIPLAQVTVDGGACETDARGQFELALSPGVWTVEVRAAGFAPGAFEERVSAGEQVTVHYRLERTAPRDLETVVRARAERSELVRMSLSGAELRQVAGTRGEPLRVVTLLPGVVTPFTGLSYPVVRGAVPGATGFFLDGVRVPQLYHLLLGSSVVHPDFIEGIDFFAANAPTRYGRVSGGVVAASVARPRDQLHISLSPNLLGTSAFVEVPIEKTGTHVTVAGSIGYAAWLLGALSSAGAFDGAAPKFQTFDYQARVEQKLGSARLRLLAFGASDTLGLEQRGGSMGVTSRFHRVDLRADVPLGPGVFQVGSGLGWDTVRLDAGQGEATAAFGFDQFAWTARASYRLDLTEHLQFRAGFDLERQLTEAQSTLRAGAADSLSTQPTTLGVFTGSFAEAAFLSGPVDVVAGIRVDTWHQHPKLTLPSVDPRVEVRVRPTQSLTLLASAGLAHQAPLLQLPLPVSDAAALGDGLQEVGQFSVGANARLPWHDLELSGTVFLNHLFQARERSLVAFVTGAQPYDHALSNRWGRAYGLEVMLRLPQRGRVFGWLTYALMRSERLRGFAIFDERQSSVSRGTELLPFAFDQTHSLNLVIGLNLSFGWAASLSAHFNSGKPESGEITSRTARTVTGEDGSRVWQPVPLNEVERLPPSGRVDLRVSKTFLFDSFTLELFLDLLNAFFLPETIGYTYTYTYAQREDGQFVRDTPLKTGITVPLALPTLGLKAVY